MLRKEIFEIPIYRLSLEAFGNETEKYREDYASPPEFLVDAGYWDNMSDKEKRQMQESGRKYFNRSPLGRGWKYNEIIGYLSIEAGFRQINAELWLIDSKRIGRRTVRKIFRHLGKAFERLVFPGDNSADVMNKIFEAINEFQSRRLFKGRYIDTEAFKNIAPYVDWLAITNTD